MPFGNQHILPCERFEPRSHFKSRLSLIVRVNVVLNIRTLQTKHQIDWDSATCITYSTDYHQRLTLESWFTNLEQTPLNRSHQLPAPYKRLIDEMKRN